VSRQRRRLLVHSSTLPNPVLFLLQHYYVYNGLHTGYYLLIVPRQSHSFTKINYKSKQYDDPLARKECPLAATAFHSLFSLHFDYLYYSPSLVE
jgi:hypothetical protein